MRILVVNPPRVKGYAVVREEKFEHKEAGSVYPPLNLLYTAAVLERDGHEVSFIDANGLNIPYEELTKQMKQLSPEVVVSRTAFDTQEEDCRVLDAAKKLGATTVVRNKIISDVPKLREKLMSRGCIDFFLNQEPESVITKLVDAIQSGEDPRSVPGISYMRNAKVVTTENRKTLVNVDTLPFPAYHLVGMLEPYSSSLFDKGYTALLSSRGCPFRCTFCAYGKEPCRMRSPENVVAELEFLKEKHGLERFLFFDDTFTLDRQRAIRICELMIEHKLDLEWATCTRANLVDRETLEVMKEAGCREIAFGIESGSPSVLKTIKKGVSRDQMRNAARLCKEAGILFSALVIIGLPGETRRTVQESVDFIKEIDPFYTQFTYAVPFPNTEMFSYYDENDLILTKDWSRYCTIEQPIARTKGLTYEELVGLRKQAYFQLLLRPGYLLRNVSLTDWRWNWSASRKLMSRVYALARDKVVR
jgi:anaerobic magnesium-protoporphyrin IX monomethyl ester cyclase